MQLKRRLLSTAAYFIIMAVMAIGLTYPAAVYAATYDLTVIKSGTGSGQVQGLNIWCGENCNATFDSGTVIHLDAMPNPGSDFAGWSGGGCTGTDSMCQVTMDEVKSVTATFNILPTVAGSDVAGNLKVSVYSNGSMELQRYVSGAWDNQTYGRSKGATLYVNGSSCDFGIGGTGDAATNTGNSASGNKITSSWTCSNGTSVKQETTYIDGNAYATYKWTITNTSGSAISDLRFFHVGWNDNLGAGFWDSASNIIGAQKQSSPGNFQKMSLQGLSVPFNHQSEFVNNVFDAARSGAFALNGTIDSSEATQNSYALEWRQASLAAGDSWSITAYEKSADVTAGGLMVNPPVAAEVTAGSSPTITYTVQNNTGSADSTNLSASVDKAGWTATVISPSSPATIPAGGSVTVMVNVTAPAGTAADTTAKITLTATGVTTANDFCSITVVRGTKVDWSDKTILATPPYSIVRSGGTNKNLSTSSTASITDTDTLLHNTIYTYTITDSSSTPGTDTVTVHTPLYNGWNIIGIPYNTAGLPIATVLGSPYSVYEWVPSGSSNPDFNGKYITVSELTPGKGYFIAGSSSNTLTYTGSTNSSFVDVTLNPGYTLITPTLDMKMDTQLWGIDSGTLKAAIDAGQIDNTLYWWNGAGYTDYPIYTPSPEAYGTVEQYKAYWILNKDTVPHTLKINGPT